jgi:phosphopantetheinyl transferase (holo-ACP synthase)
MKWKEVTSSLDSPSEIEIKFETYRYYLDSICSQIEQEYTAWRLFCKFCLKETNSLQGISGLDEAWVKRWMKIAWNTEYLMRENTEEYELIRFNNQWKPIQSYNTVYAASEAVAYVLDGKHADGHQKSMKKVTDYLAKTKLSPWNKAFKGAKGKNGNDHKPVNFPADISIPHNLQRVDIAPIGMIAKCLKVEHKHRIDDLFIKKKGHYKYNFNPGLTGIIHFLYRLRVKSNYKDVEIFVSGAPPENIKSFSGSLEKIVLYTLTLLEIILIRKCKKKFALEVAKEYLKINKNADILTRRMKYYKSNI